MKMNLGRLPFVTYPEPYDDSGSELAFVIPLFNSSTQLLLDYSLVSGAIASGRSFILNTDVVERRIPIFFFVEDSVYQIWGEVFLRLGVPASRIRTFTAPPAKMDWRRTSKRLYVMHDPVISQYENYILSDADQFACRKVGVDKIRTDYLQGDTFAVTSSGFSNPDISLGADRFYWFNKWSGASTDEEHFERSEQALQEIRPDLSFKQSIPYFIGDCNFMRFPKSLPKDFTDFIFELEPVIGDEEPIFSLWQTLLAGQIDLLNVRGMAHSVGAMYRHRDTMGYWCHAYTDSMTMESWETDFRADIGI